MKLRWLFTEPTVDEHDVVQHITWQRRFHSALLVIGYVTVVTTVTLLILSALDTRDPAVEPGYGATLGEPDR